MIRRFAALALALVVLLVARGAAAHTIGLSHGDYTLDRSSLHAKITLRSEDLARAAPRADVDGDGALSPIEIANGTSSLDDVVTHAVHATVAGAPCASESSSIHPDGTDGVAFELEWTCAGTGEIALELGFLSVLPSGHRHLASVSTGGVTRDELVVLAAPRLVVGDGSGEAPRASGFGGLVVDGLLHILSGADHLAFLFGVLLSFAVVSGPREAVRKRAGPLVLMLTAFTVGHTAALATATLGGFAPPSRFIEPAVALSVAYIGLENVASFRVRPRALVTLAFGFVHGFAYASGLLPLGIPKERLPFAVVAFNLGVELGQLAVVAVVLPLIVLGEKNARFPLARKIAASALVVAGLVWFVDRIVHPS